MSKGKINVSVENIFPLIKKFLYSDQEIFLRELISNATDATLKLKHLSNIGESKVNIEKPLMNISSYKLIDLQNIAKKLKISIYDDNEKRYHKSELYNMIKSTF